ncbi:hypothetical protein LTR08_007793 [Meristemomyces frigidus]|nr:hypothetical protein LTR08_007793 [Meristemomyces frigidus]
MDPQLIAHTHSLLQTLSTSPYPDLPTPDNVPKRASVAFVLRITPSYDHWPPAPTEKIDDLDTFFAQEWVQHGEPEVLFIKRASRRGDRWTSHIALPGGKRDKTDADDKAAAVRETLEEVGLDVEAYGIECGNLPHRLVTTHWGRKTLLVLCPYVFLLTTHNTPPLRLQPTEVAATHWVPLRSLASPAQRTVVFEDVSSRLANQETGVQKWMLSVILGKMMFAAIDLLPTESLHSAETPAPDSASPHTAPTTMSSRLKPFFAPFPPPQQRAADTKLLWGLTLGVVSDFLDLIPPHTALTLWTYPTFTPLDVRLWVWLMTYRFKDRKRAELQAGSTILHRPSFGGATESLASSAVLVPRVGGSEDEKEDGEAEQAAAFGRADETGLHGLGSGSVTVGSKAAVATMLEGYVETAARVVLPEVTDGGRYYDIVRRAVGVALVGRAGLVAILAVVVWRRTWR